MKIIDVTKDNFESEVIKSNIPVLIDFNADWCGPCRMLRPILDSYSEENNDCKIVSINVDEEEELARKYGVMSIPCLVLIENGQEIKRNVGLISKDELQNFLNMK